MNSLLQHPNFQRDFNALANVSLNPARHTSANAKEHSEAVAKEALSIAKQNGCSEEEQRVLEALGYIHDIGKISGNANAGESSALLPQYEITHPTLISLVQNHDVNLPWWISDQKGQAPSDKAWRRLAGKVDMRLLCLFMVADRVDCPGGWRANKPLVWFLSEAKRRGLLTQELRLPECNQEPPVERCAGGVLRRERDGEAEILVVKMRGDLYELPKGHIEANETPEAAAAREFLEETGISVEIQAPLGELEYPLTDITGTKKVLYFSCVSKQDNDNQNPTLRWIKMNEIEGLPLISESLRPLLQKAAQR
jgi:8-oxo-dGTP pyrophosphatase MutT (NUDIX family)